jgi:protein transport protein SEC31
LASFDNKSHSTEPVPSTHGRPKGAAASGSVHVSVSQVVENKSLVAACDAFHHALSSGDLKSLCASKAASAGSTGDAEIWTLMKIICFEMNAREELLTYLGFDGKEIAEAANSFVASVASRGSDAADTFGAPFPAAAADRSGGSDVDPEVVNVAEVAIRNALVVGNFAAAVDCCIEAGLMAEALLLAQCGDPGLWTRTQATFFERYRKKRPFLDVLGAIINNHLEELVKTSDLYRWKETLAILSTYGKSEEFSHLCETLAARLETEGRDPASATMCYMCANNVPRTVGFWVEELKLANLTLGQMDFTALQNFVEKVVVYVEANNVNSAKGTVNGMTNKATSVAQLQPECAEYFAAYANLLASQGRLELAPTYLRGETQGECILRDRLYHAGGPKPAGSRPPQFPFVRVVVPTVQVNAVDSGVPSVPGTVGGKGQPQQKPQRLSSGGASAATPLSPQGADPRAAQQASGAANTHFAPHAQAATAVVAPSASVSAAVSPAPAAAASYGSLPPGWLQLFDPNTNRPYYVNQATNQSQWEPPALVTQQPSPAVAAAPAIAHTVAGANPAPSGNAVAPANIPQIAQPARAAQVSSAAVGGHPGPSAPVLTTAAAPVPALVEESIRPATNVSSPFMVTLDNVIQGLLGRFLFYRWLTFA